MPGVPAMVFREPSLNAFLRLGREAWSAARGRLRELLAGSSGLPAVREALIPLADVEPMLPVEIGDYVDFYSSIEHASNVGRLFRPEGDPLTPNWRHLPIGYHGRAGTVVVSGTPVRRPCGQLAPLAPGGPASLGPEPWLDFELELGFVTGSGAVVGSPVPTSAAAEVIFGFALVCDWSARQIQLWESQPLGPFLSKSFATSMSPWIVPLEALAPLRVFGVAQQPEPLPYLRVGEPWALDIDLSVALRAEGADVETVVSRTNARGLYWNAAQQLAHATVNGASVRAGDLFASGTISGPESGTYGCLLELSWGGRDPLRLANGTTRTFLEDGDTVVMRGQGERDGVMISFGEVVGRVEPAG
jgi:fumarylacetoacetase